MRRRLLLVALLVVLSGCSDVSFGGTGPAAAPGDTVTPVPVTETTTATANGTDDGGDLPPGVGVDGEVDAAALWEAHERSLGDRSYTWVVRFDNDESDGQFLRRAHVDGETLYVEQVRPEPGAGTSLYVNESGGFVRSTTEDETSYQRLQRPGGPGQYVFADEAVRRFLDGPTFEVTTVERRGETYHRLYTAGDRAPDLLGRSGAEIRNYSATAYVSPDGFVRTLAVEYDRLARGNRAHVSFRYDYSDVGSTTPVAPEWVSDAADRTTATPTDGPEDPTPTDVLEEPTPTDGPEEPTPPTPPTPVSDRHNATATVGGS